MKLKSKILYSSLASAAVLMTSIFVPIVPCKTAPGVPNPIWSWKMCSLNPDKISTLGSITKYLGYSSSLKDTYVLIIAISFAVAFSFFHFFISTRGK